MSHWSFYFLAKLGLFHAGRLDFHWQLNLCCWRSRCCGHSLLEE